MAKTDNYVFKKDVAEGDKLPPQAKGMLAILKPAGTAGLTGEKLCARMTEESKKEGGLISTNQPVERIVAFYQKRLVDGGFMAVVKAPKVEKKPKEPAKADAPAAAQPAKNAAQ